MLRDDPKLSDEERWELFIKRQVVRFETEEHDENPPGKVKKEPDQPDCLRCYTPYLTVQDVFGKSRAVLMDVNRGKIKAEVSLGYASILVHVGKRDESEFQVVLTPDTIITETRDQLGLTISEAKPWDPITFRLPKKQDTAELVSHLREMVLRMTHSLFLRCEPDHLLLTAQAPPYQYLRFHEGCRGDVGQFLLGGYMFITNTASTLDQRYRLVWTELVGPDYQGVVRFLHFTRPGQVGIHYKSTEVFKGLEDYLSGNVIRLPKHKWGDGLREVRSRAYYPMIFRCAEEARLWVDLGVAVREGHRGRKDCQPLANKERRVREVNNILRERFWGPGLPDIPLLETEDEVLDCHREAPDPEDPIKTNWLKREEMARKACIAEAKKLQQAMQKPGDTSNQNDTTVWTMESING